MRIFMLDKFGSGLSWLGPEGIHYFWQMGHIFIFQIRENNRIRKYLKASPYTVQGGKLAFISVVPGILAMVSFLRQKGSC